MVGRVSQPKTRRWGLLEKRKRDTERKEEKLDVLKSNSERSDKDNKWLPFKPHRGITVLTDLEP